MRLANYFRPGCILLLTGEPCRVLCIHQDGRKRHGLKYVFVPNFSASAWEGELFLIKGYKGLQYRATILPVTLVSQIKD